MKRFSHGRPMKSPDVLGSIDADVMKLNVNNVTSKKTYAEAVTHNPTVTAVESVVDVGVPFGDVSAKKTYLEALTHTASRVTTMKAAGDDAIGERGTEQHAFSDSTVHQKAFCANEPKVNLTKATDICSVKHHDLKPVEEVVIFSAACDKMLPNISPLNVDLSTPSLHTLLPNKGHALIGEIRTSSAGELCRVIGVFPDGNPLLEAIEEPFSGQENTTLNNTSTVGTPTFCPPTKEMSHSNLFKNSGPTKRGAKAGCRRCLTLFARGTAKVKHMENCPSKLPVNDIADFMSSSDDSINVENLSLNSSNTSQLSHASINEATPMFDDADVTPTNVGNKEQSMDDNSILYDAVFINSMDSAIKGDGSVQCLELVHEPVAKQVESGVIAAKPCVNLFQVGLKPDKPRANLLNSGLKPVQPEKSSVSSVFKPAEGGANLVDLGLDHVETVVQQSDAQENENKPLYQLGDPETRVVDRGPQLSMQFTGSELQILQLPGLRNNNYVGIMYKHAFLDAHSGELASQYVPYINDAEEEHDPLHYFFQLEFLHPDDVSTSLVWVSKEFVLRVSSI